MSHLEPSAFLWLSIPRHINTSSLHLGSFQQTVMSSNKLLDLPLELRLLVYRHLLVQTEQPVTPRSIYHVYAPTYPSLNILLACRRIHDEAYQIFYRDNHFYFWDVKDLHDFLKSLGTKRRRQIRRLGFYWQPWEHRTKDSVKGAFILLSKCIRLTDFELTLAPLHVDTDISTLWGIDRLLVLRGMRRVSIKRTSLNNEGSDNGNDEGPPRVEWNTPIANRLKRAWLTPRPRCNVCEREGPIV